MLIYANVFRTTFALSARVDALGRSRPGRATYSEAAAVAAHLGDDRNRALRAVVARAHRTSAARTRRTGTRAGGETVLGLPTTAALVDRLAVDTTLRQLCGFDLRKKKMPGEHLFSRAFKEFSAQGLMQQAHEALITSSEAFLVEHQLYQLVKRDSPFFMKNSG